MGWRRMNVITDEGTEGNRPPLSPSAIRDAAVSELDAVTSMVDSLTREEWPRPSGMAGRTIGDTVAHLVVSLPLYSQFLDAIVSGRAGGGMWKTLGDVSRALAPMAGPALGALSNAASKITASTVPPDTLKKQLANSAKSLREKLDAIDSGDYARTATWLGRPLPLASFLMLAVNDIGLSGWDIASALNPQARLDEPARQILPWFYWSNPEMLHAAVSGTVMVELSGPTATLSWTLAPTAVKPSQTPIETPDATITAGADTFVLTLAGRVSALDALRFAAILVSGNEELARTFLQSWRML